MSHESLEVMDVGLAVDLKAAFKRNGWSTEEVKRACAGDFFGKIHPVLLGRAEVTYPEHLVDLDADPFVPSGWAVEEHQRGGSFKLDPVKIKLCLSPHQQGEKWIDGHKLREELKKQRVYNANLLDYLIAHPHLIPEDWKGKFVFFWGTTYRDSDGRLSVRCLCWDGDAWFWRCYWLDGRWHVSRPAAVAAS